MTEYRISGTHDGLYIDQPADDTNILEHLSTMNPTWTIRLQKYVFGANPEGTAVTVFRGTVKELKRQMTQG